MELSGLSLRRLPRPICPTPMEKNRLSKPRHSLVYKRITDEARLAETQLLKLNVKGDRNPNDKLFIRESSIKHAF